MSWLPHHTNIGCCEVRMMRTQVRRLLGQVCGGPSGDRDQSMARMRCPISPPPERNAKTSVAGSKGGFSSSKVTIDPLARRALGGVRHFAASDGFRKVTLLRLRFVQRD